MRIEWPTHLVLVVAATAALSAAQVGADAKTVPAGAAAAVADQASDAAITAAVKAELARDSQLGLLRIEVDTLDGRVVLRGNAPDAAARERATMLAGAVSGVVAVENLLAVGRN